MPSREISVLLADAAVSDIRDIYQHIALANSVAVADDIYRQILAAIERIGPGTRRVALLVRMSVRAPHRSGKFGSSGMADRSRGAV